MKSLHQATYFAVLPDFACMIPLPECQGGTRPNMSFFAQYPVGGALLAQEWSPASDLSKKQSWAHRMILCCQPHAVQLQLAPSTLHHCSPYCLWRAPKGRFSSFHSRRKISSDKRGRYSNHRHCLYLEHGQPLRTYPRP